ncbi:DNA phosphorothioation-associated putative methyltransferase [Geodermatophilus normandii]|uniref:DNA phosphorothioation-associated putative methyltransferase n=2 Tax=Geodermatophilus normandii TaxID=1137989 RepID=A0A317QLA1_9ACTN|nr:DNA phosphorothioation-associated putative methyltransferase [Geodermatophilus normandii]
MPVRQALQDGVVRPDTSVLDFGSGRGGDVARLRAMGVEARGWDPYFDPDVAATPSNAVLLVYVLNVIEDDAERTETLRRAWTLADQVLVVSTRLSWERRKVTGVPLADGTMTSRRTFQRLFSPGELRALVERTTKAGTAAGAPGVVYAFKSETERLRFLARRTTGVVEWLGGEDETSALAAVIDYFERRGRLPAVEEYPEHLLPLLRHVRQAELRRMVVEGAAAERVELGRARTLLDTLLFLGVSVFSGRPRMNDLPLGVQLDVRACFSSYREACARADRLLLKLRDDSYVRGAMRNSVGKLTPTALYVHRRAVERMPVVLRLYEHCGAVAAGRPEGWDVLKLNHSGRQVAWSSYPTFDSEPHPRLAWSYAVSMSTLDAQFSSYEERENRPLLHRKEEFLAYDDEAAPKYRRLTAQEVRAGLYERPEIIGLERGWQAELARCGVELRGHRLVKSRAD